MRVQTVWPNAGILRMFRGHTAQHYPVKRATWGFCQDDRYSIPVLCFSVSSC